jgi:hypothetical protein
MAMRVCVCVGCIGRVEKILKKKVWDDEKFLAWRKGCGNQGWVKRLGGIKKFFFSRLAKQHPDIIAIGTWNLFKSQSTTTRQTDKKTIAPQTTS